VSGVGGRKRARVLLCLAAVAGFGTLTSLASALEPVAIELAAQGGGGTSPWTGTPNPLGLGVGGRAGVSFRGLYGGLSLMYYLGGSTNFADGTTLSTHALMYGVEGGYGFNMPLVTVRPQLGIGNFSLAAACSAGCGSSSNLYLEPGVTALLTFGQIFLGADANLLFVPNLDQAQVAFTVHGQLGVKL